MFARGGGKCDTKSDPRGLDDLVKSSLVLSPTVVSTQSGTYIRVIHSPLHVLVGTGHSKIYMSGHTSTKLNVIIKLSLS